jgi:pimeloyl-ACP methyl ester carboxylesterase
MATSGLYGMCPALAGGAGRGTVPGIVKPASTDKDMNAPAQFLNVDEGGNKPRKIAYRVAEGSDPRAPGLVWLSGFKSDMLGTKAEALADWARGKGASCLRFDYSGHGESGGRIEDFTAGDWLAETLTAFRALTNGPQIVIGSSMGGWLALLLARALQADAADAARLRALVLIAPAWDMTEELMWKHFPPDALAALERDGVYYRPSEYGEPYAITRALIESGRAHLIGGGMDAGCPVRIIQGMRDVDVPWQHVVKLADILAGDDLRITLVKDAEHRLSRDQDLATLYAMIAEFLPGGDES